MWGWIADVTLNEDCVELSFEDKMILLDWMYNNWDNMKERSIRTVEKMAETMIERELLGFSLETVGLDCHGYQCLPYLCLLG